MTDYILASTQDGVCRITINRPEKKNALTLDMYRALTAAIRAAEADDGARAIMLEGVPEIFTAGNDLADFMSGAAFEGEHPPVFDFITTVVKCPLPLVAAISGGAIGIGTTILLHFDLVYADESAYFHMPFANLGLVPEAGASFLLPRRYGRQIAGELLVQAKKISPYRALEMGFINSIVTDGDVRTHALDCAKEVAAKPPIAMSHTKELLAQEREELLEHIAHEGHIFAERAQSDEMRAAVMAMMTKR